MSLRLQRTWLLLALASAVLTATADCGSDHQQAQSADAGTSNDGSPADGANVDGAAGPSCGSGSPESLAACVDQARYVADLTFITGVRTPGSPHWLEVQNRCASRFAELGYEVEREAYGTGVNVI